MNALSQLYSKKRVAFVVFIFFVALEIAAKTEPQDGAQSASGAVRVVQKIVDNLFVSWLGRDISALLFGALAIFVPFRILRKPSKGKPKRTTSKSRPVSEKTEPKWSDEDLRLGVIYNATISDSFDWAFSHLDRLSDFYDIHKSLVKRGYGEIADVSMQMFNLYCTANNVEGVDKVDLPADQCMTELNRIEQKAHDDGVFEQFNKDMDALFSN